MAVGVIHCRYGYWLALIITVLYYWSNYPVHGDVIVIPNVPRSFWIELIKYYKGNETIQIEPEYMTEGVKVIDKEDVEEQDIKSGKSSEDYVKSLTATVTVWCIASFMILTVLAAVAFFVMHKRRHVKFAPLPNESQRL